MLECIEYNDMIKDIGDNECTVGILIAHPDSKFIKGILNKLSYFHHRSGESINFYFPGYGAYWYGIYPDEKEVCKVENVQWSFSSKMLVEFIDEMESSSNWEYNGETELILVNYKNGKLDFSEVIVFWIDRMIGDNVISSPDYLFENIFRYFRKNKSLYRYSDKSVLDVLSADILEIIKKSILKSLSHTFDKSKYFCIRNLK